jgi:serine/threonine protein kinase
MEFAEKGSLNDLIYKRKEDNAPFSEKEIMMMFVNIAFSLLEVNSRGIFHRDLKPENMLLYNSDTIEYITLTDFGASKYSLSTEKN